MTIWETSWNVGSAALSTTRINKFSQLYSERFPSLPPQLSSRELTEYCIPHRCCVFVVWLLQLPLPAASLYFCTPRGQPFLQSLLGSLQVQQFVIPQSRGPGSHLCTSVLCLIPCYPGYSYLSRHLPSQFSFQICICTTVCFILVLGHILNS